MPFQRFDDFDSARRALWTDSADADLPRRIARVWRFSARLAPAIVPRGVTRFRTIEEANDERDARERKRIAALRRDRAPGASDERAR